MRPGFEARSGRAGVQFVANSFDQIGLTIWEVFAIVNECLEQLTTIIITRTARGRWCSAELA